MSANISINLDLDRVQSSVAAAIRPTVDKMLRDVDVPALVEAELARSPDQERSMYTLFYGGGSSPAKSLLEHMVREEIKQMAKQYVQSEMRCQKDKIEAAFHRMMKESANKLVASFAGAIDKSLMEDFEFELKVSVETAKTRDDDE